MKFACRLIFQTLVSKVNEMFSFIHHEVFQFLCSRKKTLGSYLNTSIDGFFASDCFQTDLDDFQQAFEKKTNLHNLCVDFFQKNKDFVFFYGHSVFILFTGSVS